MHSIARQKGSASQWLGLKARELGRVLGSSGPRSRLTLVPTVSLHSAGSRAKLRLLTLYGHIKTTEQPTNTDTGR